MYLILIGICNFYVHCIYNQSTGKGLQKSSGVNLKRVTISVNVSKLVVTSVKQCLCVPLTYFEMHRCISLKPHPLQLILINFKDPQDLGYK